MVGSAKEYKVAIEANEDEVVNWVHTLDLVLFADVQRVYTRPGFITRAPRLPNRTYVRARVCARVCVGLRVRHVCWVLKVRVVLTAFVTQGNKEVFGLSLIHAQKFLNEHQKTMTTFALRQSKFVFCRKRAHVMLQFGTQGRNTLAF